MTDAQHHWLAIALQAGDGGFCSPRNAALDKLARMRLIERNPCTSGVHTQWRATAQAVRSYVVVL